jgi:hypothetical protein
LCIAALDSLLALTLAVLLCCFILMRALCVQVAALIDEALRKMGGVSSNAVQDGRLLRVDTAVGAAAASGWDSNAVYSSSTDAGGGGSYSSSASSDEEVEVAGGLR